jgi:hypothetical protein
MVKTPSERGFTTNELCHMWISGKSCRFLVRLILRGMLPIQIRQAELEEPLMIGQWRSERQVGPRASIQVYSTMSPDMRLSSYESG